MRWSLVNFGKHRGKSLPQVIFADPDYFFWAYEQKRFTANLLAEAEELYRKARSIRIPQSGGEKKVVEYVIDKPTGKFGTIRLITQPEGPSAYSDETIHLFRRIPSICSENKYPSIPKVTIQGVEA